MHIGDGDKVGTQTSQRFVSVTVTTVCRSLLRTTQQHRVRIRDNWMAQRGSHIHIHQDDKVHRNESNMMQTGEMISSEEQQATSTLRRVEVRGNACIDNL